MVQDVNQDTDHNGHSGVTRHQARVMARCLLEKARNT